MLPPWYYVFEFFDDQKVKDVSNYVHRYQTKLGMYEQLTGHVTSPLSNKYEFARWLDEAGEPEATKQSRRQPSSGIITIVMSNSNVILKTSLIAIIFGPRLKTLKGVTPYEFVAKTWTNEPKRFILNPSTHCRD